MRFKVKNCDELQLALDALCRYLREQQVSQERIFDSRVVACELIGNVLRHAEGEAELRSVVQNGYIELTVASDTACALPQKIECADVYAEHGRGLYLVEQLSERMTVEAAAIKVLLHCL